MTSPTSIELLEDRIKFKFHAAQEHLKNLKSLESEGGLNKNSDTRVRSEIEIEDILAHLIAVVDALLVRINKKLNLGIPEDKVFLPIVKKKLGKKKRLNLIKELVDLDDNKSSWYSILRERRNTGTHRNIINLSISVELFENANTGKGYSGPIRVTFKDDPQLEVIPDLEDRFSKMQSLIQTIINKDPLLSSP